MRRKFMLKRAIIVAMALACLAAAVFAGGQRAPLGTEENPIKMYFVPSGEVAKIIKNGDAIADYLNEATGYHFKTAVPTSYAAVIEAMGTEEADIGWLATFAYVIANDKYDVYPRLKVFRFGSAMYKGQFIVRADSGIETIADLKGKTIAYTDALSTSGFIYPSAKLAMEGITIKDSIFAGGHPQAVLAVYDGTVDAGCTYYAEPSSDGTINDARARVLETHPDVAEKVKIIGFTDFIPNDTVSFRQDFPKDIEDKIVEALKVYHETEGGAEALDELYTIHHLVDATDDDYEIVRKSIKALGKKAEDFLGD
jgi:phosphonate transport system substrate-binding protein